MSNSDRLLRAEDFQGYGPSSNSERGYQLLEPLGQGGMGSVVRAWDPVLQRHVAIKFLLGEGRSGRLERFRREAEITASLNHPGIVRLHATGVAAGRPFLVLELVEGARSLAEAVTGLDRRARVALIRDAARALGHAHAHGVVHRDVKHENLLVDAEGRLRVADFGLAATQGVERLTRTGALVGTPYSMAPEQLGGGAQVGPQTDVWALGVLLYELVSGQRPFEGGSLLELTRRVLYEAPPPLPRIGGLRAVLERALRKDPRERYPDGEALAAALDGWLSSAEGSKRRWRAPAVVITALALGGAAVTVGPQDPPGRPGLSPSRVAVAPVAPSRSEVEPKVKSTQSSTPPPATVTRSAKAWRAALAKFGQQRLEAVARWVSSSAPDDPLRVEARAWIHAHGLERPLAETQVVPEERGLEVAWRSKELVAVGGGVAARFSPELVELERRSIPLKLFVRDLVLMPLGLFTGSRSKGVMIRAQKVHQLTVPFRSVACSPNGQQLVVGVTGRPKALARLDPRTARVLRWDQVGARNLDRLAYSPDGKFLIGASSRPGEDMLTVGAGKLWVWNRAGRRYHATMLPGRCESLAFSRDGRSILLGLWSGQLLLFDGPPQKPRRPRVVFNADRGVRVGAHQGTVHGVASSRDGARVFSIGAGITRWNDLVAWSAVTGKELQRVELTYSPFSLSLSRDGRLLAVGSRDGRVLIYLVDL